MFGLVSSSASEQDMPAVLVTSGGSVTKGPALEGPPVVKKFAVVIGIVYDNYDLGVVNYADQDALSVYNLLTQKLGFPRENVLLLRNGEATGTGIHKAISWLVRNPDVDADADVVFFYSGHGLRNRAAAGLEDNGAQPGYALVPYDFANFDYAQGAGLMWDSYLADMLSRINPRRMWITIDSCVAGGFTRPGISGPNRVVTLSSQADQLSSEVQETGRGVLTQYMIEDGVARGVPVEKAFAAAVPRAFDAYGQNPQIVDNYPGELDLYHEPSSN